MKKYNIPVTWQMIDNIEIDANSLEEAMEKLSYINSQSDLPKGKYVGNSFEVQIDFIDESL